MRGTSWTSTTVEGVGSWSPNPHPNSMLFNIEGEEVGRDRFGVQSLSGTSIIMRIDCRTPFIKILETRSQRSDRFISLTRYRKNYTGR